MKKTKKILDNYNKVRTTMRQHGRVLGRPDVVKKYLETRYQHEACLAREEPKEYGEWPVYILMRTSNRPEYFKVCYESIKSQTYPNIKIIVHTDDPRDTYVKGDIIIKGHAYPPKVGTGPYNLYNNRLLEAIPEGPGWYHYIDDDDMYSAPDVIEKMVKGARRNYCNIGKVMRWHGTVWPKKWRVQRSFQTECFFLHTDHKKRSHWWSNKGGDHYYSRKLTNQIGINWIDGVLICKAQEGKSHGRRIDLGQVRTDKNRTFRADEIVDIMVFAQDKRSGKFKKMPFADALKIENSGKGIITYEGVTVEYNCIEVKKSMTDTIIERTREITHL
jgi:glycosyltransferase involved in cell wall biosynthesis